MQSIEQSSGVIQVVHTIHDNYTVKVAAVSVNQTPLDWEHNQANILQAMTKAREAQATIVCFPELCISGYGCEDMFLAKETCQIALEVLETLVKATKGMIVAVGLPLLFQNSLYNTACLMVDGRIVGFVAKQNLANDGVHYEFRWFKPWIKGSTATIKLNNQFYPIGDYVFDFKYFRLGFEICEDAWVPERTGISLANRSVDIILNPSASHFAFKKCEIRKQFVTKGTDIFKAGYIYANLLGNEAGRLIYDGDTLIAAGKEILAEGPRFSFQDYVLTTAMLDIEVIREQRILPFEYFTAIPFTSETTNVPNTPNQKEEEFSRAVALGLFDYMRKSYSKGFVLNLSGGADSAACASLVYLMVRLGCQELGEIGFQKKLSYIYKNLNLNINKSSEIIQEIISSILYCLYQRTKNNSEETWQAASFFTQSLGIPLTELFIDPLVKSYCEMIEPVIGRALKWSEDDIALQNIQARVRAPGAWLLANVRNSILLSTSNRSEASVGYATMDGDTCGGLCPIAGVDKSFILQWLKWLEQKGVMGVGPIPGLKMINTLKPTAELRPFDESQNTPQVDETDLMPYGLLDRIEKLFVRDKLSPLEILWLLVRQYPAESPKMLAMFIERFFNLWTNNQWKRERFAPAFHLDDESVDPKTWFRFPILSGGFKRELKQMLKMVSNSDI